MVPWSPALLLLSLPYSNLLLSLLIGHNLLIPLFFLFDHRHFFKSDTPFLFIQV